MKKWVLGLSVAMLVVGGSAQAGGDKAAGQAKSVMCAACHGADGNSVNPIWPNLAGQNESYLAKQLTDFKSGDRKDPTMTGMAAALTADDVNNIAAYFSSQKGKGGVAAADKVALGEIIYRSGNAAKGLPACTACHGPTGSGVATSGFPAVSGQHAAYVEKQLKDFASRTRQNDANQMMRNIAAKMSADEIAAVAQYMQGLK